MQDDRYQVMPDLTPEEYEALKADIAARGVQVPIEFDESGNVLDGHHRLRACSELGITDYPTITREGMTEEEKIVHAYKLNTARRHLAPEQLREAVAEALRRFPDKSNREIASIMGVSHPTVGKYRRQLEESGQVVSVTTRTGADGRPYTVQDRSAAQLGLGTFTCCICGKEAPAFYEESKSEKGKIVNVWGFDPWPVQRDGDCCQGCSLALDDVVDRMPEEAKYRHWLGPHWRALLDVARAMQDEEHEAYGDYKAHRSPEALEAEFERRLHELGIDDVWH